MNKKVFVASTPDLHDMSVVGVAGFSEAGNLELPRWASEFKDLKVVFYADLPVTQSAWGEVSEIEKIDNSIFDTRPAPNQGVGILGELFGSEVTGFSRNVFRVKPSDAVRKIAERIGHLEWDFYFCNNQIKSLVHRVVQARDEGFRERRQAFEELFMAHEDEIRMGFLAENQKWLVVLQRFEELAVQELGRFSYQPPTSVPIGKVFRGLLGGYGSSVAREVEVYKAEFKVRIVEAILVLAKKNEALFHPLKNSYTGLSCPLCQGSVVGVPSILQPDSDYPGDPLWLLRCRSLSEVTSLRALTGVSLFCSVCGEGAFSNFSSPHQGIAILFDGLNARHFSGPLEMVVHYLLHRAFPTVFVLST